MRHSGAFKMPPSARPKLFHLQRPPLGILGLLAVLPWFSLRNSVPVAVLRRPRPARIRVPFLCNAAHQRKRTSQHQQRQEQDWQARLPRSLALGEGPAPLVFLTASAVARRVPLDGHKSWTPARHPGAALWLPSQRSASYDPNHITVTVGGAGFIPEGIRIGRNRPMPSELSRSPGASDTEDRESRPAEPWTGIGKHRGEP